MKEKPVVVAPRIFQRHPELGFEEIIMAYMNAFRCGWRPNGDMVMLGMGEKNRELEIIAHEYEDVIVIFHAMKATKKFIREIEQRSNANL